jgi:hypothetical protein
MESLRAMTAQVASQMRRRAVFQIASQMEKLMANGTNDLLRQSLQATAIRKPSPGSVAQILNVLA